MKYKLTIIKYEENKNYETEMAKWKEKQNHYQPSTWNESSKGEPEKEIAERSLEVFLTEEEYRKVKEGVIKVFE